MTQIIRIAVWIAAAFTMIASPSAVADQMQRMLIASGCYRLAAHATGVIPAYCLDRNGRAPVRGAILGETPALGASTVTVGSQTMTLTVALAQHLLRIEGVDSPKELSLINVTNLPVSLCIGQPVVVMGNGISYSVDLKRIYGKIVDVTQSSDATPVSSSSTNTDEAHAKAQQLLWDLVNKEDEEEPSAPWPQASGPASNRDDCLAAATESSEPLVVLCH